MIKVIDKSGSGKVWFISLFSVHAHDNNYSSLVILRDLIFTYKPIHHTCTQSTDIHSDLHTSTPTYIHLLQFTYIYSNLHTSTPTDIHPLQPTYIHSNLHTSTPIYIHPLHLWDFWSCSRMSLFSSIRHRSLNDDIFIGRFLVVHSFMNSIIGELCWFRGCYHCW